MSDLEITQDDNVATPATLAPIGSTEVPAKGTPEYETWLDDTARATLAAQGHTKPEGVPDKFWNADTGAVDYAGLTKSYTELEKRLGGGKAKDVPVTDPKVDAKPDAEPDLQKAGIDRVKFATEITKDGKLSDASYAELEAKGYSKDDVDQYVEGQIAKAELAELRAEKDTVEVVATVGGQEAFNAMRSWAAANYSETDLNRFNKQVNASKDGALVALELLKVRYEAANGRAPKTFIQGGAAKASSGYESQAQAVKAMQDPRYKSDPAYRADVERKLANRSGF